MSNRKEQQRALVDELRPFFNGTRQFVVDDPPSDISVAALSVLRSVHLLENAHRTLADHLLSMDEANPDSDFDIVARDRGVHALGELIEALKTGGSHPLLDYWEGKKSHAGSRMAEGPRNQQIKQQAVGAAWCMVQQGCKRKKAEELIAGALVQAGVRRACQGSTIKNWIDATELSKRDTLAASVSEIMKDEPREKWIELIPQYLAMSLDRAFTSAHRTQHR
jgi:hypothetical protein